MLGIANNVGDFFMLGIVIRLNDWDPVLAEPKPWQCKVGGAAGRFLVMGLSINQSLASRDLVQVYRRAKNGKCRVPSTRGSAQHGALTPRVDGGTLRSTRAFVSAVTSHGIYDPFLFILVSLTCGSSLSILY